MSNVHHCQNKLTILNAEGALVKTTTLSGDRLPAVPPLPSLLPPAFSTDSTQTHTQLFFTLSWACLPEQVLGSRRHLTELTQHIWLLGYFLIVYLQAWRLCWECVGFFQFCCILPNNSTEVTDKLSASLCPYAPANQCLSRFCHEDTKGILYRCCCTL